LKARPADPVASALKADAQRNAAYAAKVAQGQAALKAMRPADALKAFDEALKLKPNDPTALGGKALAEQRMKAPAPAPVPAAPQEYARFMASGAALEGQKKWAEAAAAYSAALGKMPGDARAAAALRGAAYQQHMAAGRAAQAQKK